MYAFELLAKLRHLILSANENGKLEWVGTSQQFDETEREEERILTGQS